MPHPADLRVHRCNHEGRIELQAVSEPELAGINGAKKEFYEIRFANRYSKIHTSQWYSFGEQGNNLSTKVRA